MKVLECLVCILVYTFVSIALYWLGSSLGLSSSESICWEDIDEAYSSLILEFARGTFPTTCRECSLGLFVEDDLAATAANAVSSLNPRSLS